jgi:hypothetical protein
VHRRHADGCAHGQGGEVSGTSFYAGLVLCDVYVIVCNVLQPVFGVLDTSSHTLIHNHSLISSHPLPTFTIDHSLPIPSA